MLQLPRQILVHMGEWSLLSEENSALGMHMLARKLL